MTETGRVGLAVAVVVVAVLAVLGLVQWAASERAPFEAGSFDDVEATFAAAGLQVCAATDRPDGLAPQAVASRTYEVAVRCPLDSAQVVVDRFADVADRDAAAQRFEVLLRPRGSGVVYTFGDSTVFLQGSGDGGVRQRLTPALLAAGAR